MIRDKIPHIILAAYLFGCAFDSVKPIWPIRMTGGYYIDPVFYKHHSERRFFAWHLSFCDECESNYKERDYKETILSDLFELLDKLTDFELWRL